MIALLIEDMLKSHFGILNVANRMTTDFKLVRAGLSVWPIQFVILLG